MKHKEKHRNALQVMAGLIGMIYPLLGVMLIAVIMGCIGNLLAIFITVAGGAGIGKILGFYPDISFAALFAFIIAAAVLRGVLRYSEQASNHYIAFKLLARIRHKVFAALRRLAPAKLDGSEKGNLISIITSDIELLEVFYAHTISPIAIAVITSIFMCIFIGSFQWQLGVIAGFFYLLAGLVIPTVNSRLGQAHGRAYRKSYGELNTTVLDNLYGLDEILQYQQQNQRLEKMNLCTDKLKTTSWTLKKKETQQRITTDTVILLAGVVVLTVGAYFSGEGQLTSGGVLIAAIAMMSSFGPVAALSALSNNLNQTLASGNRVLSLLEEMPVVEDITNHQEISKGGILAENITFAYEGQEETEILKNFSAAFQKNRIHGIHGKSGCGKSTLLKLLMRFYETDEGRITYHGTDVNEINTASLRKHISYVTQDTFLFQDTIENNIKVADANASHEAVVEAAEKASIHDFIVSLPKGYDTMLNELGDSVSGGERQRIGIARAFLHKAEVILLDEPTSNIDSLNEGLILKSLEKEKKNKTIILVSHRKSTMGIADEILEM